MIRTAEDENVVGLQRIDEMRIEGADDELLEGADDESVEDEASEEGIEAQPPAEETGEEQE